MACCVDFHFDFFSPYGFLAAMKIERALPRGRYRRLLWRPFLLGAVYQRFGQSPLEHPLAKILWHDGVGMSLYAKQASRRWEADEYKNWGATRFIPISLLR